MIRTAVLALVILAIVCPSWAMGPRMKETIAVWDSSPEPEVTGYLLYWGAKDGLYTNYVTVAKDARSGTHPPPSVDLMNVIDAPGKYYIAVTAHDRYYNESGFSNSVAWNRQVIGAPTEFKILEGP